VGKLDHKSCGFTERIAAGRKRVQQVAARFADRGRSPTIDS
jgi:hypothetical protein